MKLARDNDIELSDKDYKDSGNIIINLQNYLNAQKRIFATA